MMKSLYYFCFFVIICFIEKRQANGVELSDGKPMKLEVDGSGKEDVDLDIDGVQFQIPIVRHEPGVLDFLPKDLKEEEIKHDGGVEGAMELLGNTGKKGQSN